MQLIPLLLVPHLCVNELGNIGSGNGLSPVRCISKLVSIGSGNDLLPFRHKDITWSKQTSMKLESKYKTYILETVFEIVVWEMAATFLRGK